MDFLTDLLIDLYKDKQFYLERFFYLGRKGRLRQADHYLCKFYTISRIIWIIERHFR